MHDLIVCHDTYARQAGSPARHAHDEYFHDVARQRWNRAIDLLADERPADHSVWIVRSAPLAIERAELAERVHADQVLVLMPPIDVAFARAAADFRGRRTWGAIRRWYHLYTPRPEDKVITG
jgi:hypothetical protein